MLRYNFGIITASSWTWPFRQASTFNGSGLTSEKFMTNPENEPVLTYQKGSIERIALEKAMSEIAGTTTDVPLVIGNEKILENLDKKQVMPSDHQKVIARFAHATAEQIKEAIQMGLSAKRSWERKSLRHYLHSFENEICLECIFVA